MNGVSRPLRSPLAQVERKIEHLFGLPNEATFAYYDNLDLLQDYGGAPTPIDAFPVLWRGIRESPAWEHVDATLRRVGNALLRAAPTAQLQRFAFAPQEMQAVDLLRQRPTRVIDITSMVGPSVGQLLVYLLMIMKQVDLVDAAQAKAGAAPQPPPSSGQAFARVQLQRQHAANRPGVIVEEVVSAANDERASSPGMRAPGSPFGMKQTALGAFGPPTPSAPFQPAILSAPDPAGVPAS